MVAGSTRSQAVSVLHLSSEMVTERNRGERWQIYSDDPLEGLAFSGERQHFRGLAGIAAGDLEVDPGVQFSAYELTHQRASKFAHRDTDEAVAQRFAPHLLEFSASVKMEWKPVEGAEDVH